MMGNSLSIPLPLCTNCHYKITLCVCVGGGVMKREQEFKFCEPKIMWQEPPAPRLRFEESIWWPCYRLSGQLPATKAKVHSPLEEGTGLFLRVIPITQAPPPGPSFQSFPDGNL